MVRQSGRAGSPCIRTGPHPAAAIEPAIAAMTRDVRAPNRGKTVLWFPGALTATGVGYFVTTVRSSNCVMESALVQTPTFPGPVNVPSSTS